jgi:hypothetical protein
MDPNDPPIAIGSFSILRKWWWAPAIALAPLLELVARTFGHPGTQRAADAMTQLMPGRPLRVGMTVRAPEPLRAPVAAPTSALAAQLGRAWLGDGLAEQASVAAFGQLALQLLRFGAPPELVSAVHQAALDEIVHARLCFSLAEQYGETNCGAAPFPAAVMVNREMDLATLVEESMIDGAFAEGFAANVLSWLATRSRDPAVTAVLERLAEDESRHAALGWDIARWALQVDPGSTRARLPRALERLRRLRLDLSVYPDGLVEHGRIDARRAAPLFEATRSEVAKRIGDAIEDLVKPRRHRA